TSLLETDTELGRRRLRVAPLGETYAKKPEGSHCRSPRNERVHDASLWRTRRFRLISHSLKRKVQSVVSASNRRNQTCPHGYVVQPRLRVQPVGRISERQLNPPRPPSW